MSSFGVACADAVLWMLRKGSPILGPGIDVRIGGAAASCTLSH